MWICIAALFIITLNSQQSKYPSTSEWINEIWYIYTAEGNYWYIQYRGWNSKSLCCVKEVTLKKKFHLLGPIHMTFFIFQLCQGLRVKGGNSRRIFWSGWSYSASWFWSWVHESIHVLKFIELYIKRQLILLYGHIKNTFIYLKKLKFKET